MSIWRAPLLIAGILIILLAAGALAAPWFIDFNRYKPQLERWAAEATGRDVRIAGAVAFELFPWPSARLGRVSVAGMEGGRFAQLLEVEEVRARFSLAALLGGRLEVEHVTLKKPRLMLEHLGQGRGNWLLRPRAALRLPFSAERVRIDAVEVEDGVILLADHRLRRSLRIENVRLRIHAARLSGPWRVSGTWRLMGQDWRVRASTGRMQARQPVNLSLHMAPRQGGGHVVQLDGRLVRVANAAGSDAEAADAANGSEDASLPRLEGRLVVKPVLPEGRGNPLDPARQVEIGGDVVLTPALLELKKLKLTPRFAAASPFDEVRGRLRLEFGPVLDVSVALGTTRLQLTPALARLLMSGEALPEQPAGATDGLGLLRQYLLALAQRLPALPPEVLLELDLQAARLMVDGRSFSGVALSAEASSELFSVRHLRADVPGQGDVSFRGNLLAGDLLQLTGELAVRADDVRALLFSMLPGAEAVLRPLWRGRGGRLDLLATIDLTDHAARLVSRRLLVDGGEARLDWRVFEPERSGKDSKHERGRQGNGGRMHDVRIALQRLDVDGHMRPGGEERLRRLAAVLWEWLGDDAGDADGRGSALQLELKVAKLRLGGQVWRDVVLAAQRQAGVLALRQLQARGVAGVSLDASGVFRRVRGNGGGWQGEMKARLHGGGAAAAWQVLQRMAVEVLPGEAWRADAPAWMAAAEEVDVNLLVRAGVGVAAGQDGRQGTARAEQAGQWVDVSLSGHVGGLNGSVALRVDEGGVQGERAGAAGGAQWGAGFWRRGQWRLRAEVQGQQAQALLALAGLQAAMAPDALEGQGTVRLRLDGVPERGMQGELMLQLPGLEVQVHGDALRLVAEVEGGVRQAAQWLLPVQGQVRWSLAMDDAARWREVVGVALPELAVKGQGKLAFSPRRWVFSDIRLRGPDGGELAGELVVEGISVLPARAPADGQRREARGAEEGALNTSAKQRRGRISAELVMSELQPQALLAMLLADARDGRRLRRVLAGGWQVDVRIRADALRLPRPAAQLADARVVLQQQDGVLRATLHAGNHDGDEAPALRAEAQWQRAVSGGVQTEATVHLELPLQRLLRVVDDNGPVMSGRGVLTLSLQGQAATLPGMVAGLKGVGRLRLVEARLGNVAPRRFVQMVRGIATDEALKDFDARARVVLRDGAWSLPEEVVAGVVLENGLLEVARVSFVRAGVRSEMEGLVRLADMRMDVQVRFVPLLPDDARDGQVLPPAFSLVLTGPPGALAAAWRLDDVREWAQQQVIRRKEEEIRRLEEERLRREQQMRALEEKARQEAERRRQAEEQRKRQEEERRRGKVLQEEAARLHRQLQEVLVKAHEHMKPRPPQPSAGQEDETAADGSPGGGARNGDADRQDGKGGLATGQEERRQPSSAQKPSGIEALIRQALEDDEGDGAAVASPAGQAASGGVKENGGVDVPEAHAGRGQGEQGGQGRQGKSSGQGVALPSAPLPPEAQARPQPFAGTPPQPRARPARKMPPRQSAAPASAESRSAPVRQRPAGAAVARRNAAAVRVRAARSSSSASRAVVRQRAVEKDARAGQRKMVQPLTNWNRLAP